MAPQIFLLQFYAIITEKDNLAANSIPGCFCPTTIHEWMNLLHKNSMIVR
jgi:hypothetical protein